MSGTYTPQDAITLATKLNHNAPSDPDLQAQACDFIHNRIWTRLPWDWTLQTITQITLVDGQQDYSLGGSDATNLYRFQTLEIQDTSQNPIPSRRLNEKADLSVENVTKGGLDTIRFFFWRASTQKLRLDYPAAVPVGTVLVVNGDMQIKPTKITSANLTTALAMPDHYFHVLMEGVRWYFYQLADSPRAGTTTEQGGKAVHTGQKATFFDAFDEMAKAEDFSNAEDPIYPAGGTLGAGREDQWPRIFQG